MDINTLQIRASFVTIEQNSESDKMNKKHFLISLLLFAFMGCSWDTSSNLPITPAFSTGWSNVASAISKATYLIGFKKSDGEVLVLGTGFAVSPDKIATNAHVALAIPYALDYYHFYFDDSLALVACRANEPVESQACIPLRDYVLHEGFTGLFAPDYSLFRTPVVMADTVRCADLKALHSLTVGEDIGTLGFPGETAFYLDRTFPVPIFKVGTISALHAFTNYGTQSSDEKYVIQHDFDLTGGTSGSPIFNTHGEIIAINNSGYRGVSIGFGIRIDLLSYCLRRTDYASIFDNSINEFYYFEQTLNYENLGSYSYGWNVAGVVIGDSLESVKRKLGYSSENLLDSGFIRIDRYSDGYSYRLDLLTEEGIIRRIMISNVPHQTRLNKFREYYSEFTIGTGISSVEMMYDLTRTHDTVDGIYLNNFEDQGFSVLSLQKGGFVSAILLYEEDDEMPYPEYLDKDWVAPYEPILKKVTKPRSFQDVPKFQYSSIAIRP